MGETKSRELSKTEIVQAAKPLPAVETIVNNALKAVDEFPALKEMITKNTDIDNIIMWRTYVHCSRCGYGMFWDNVGWSCWRCGNFQLHVWLGC